MLIRKEDLYKKKTIMKITITKKTLAILGVGLGIFVATSLPTFAVTYDISAEGSCNYGYSEVEQSISNCWLVAQTATYNSTQQINTSLYISVNRSSFVATTQSPVSFNCGGGCYYNVRTDAMITSSGSSATVALSGQASGSGYVSTGSSAANTTIAFTTHLTTGITCGGYNYCTVETPATTYPPFTVTSASPSVQLWFSTLTERMQSMSSVLVSSVFAMKN